MLLLIFMSRASCINTQSSGLVLYISYTAKFYLSRNSFASFLELHGAIEVDFIVCSGACLLQFSGFITTFTVFPTACIVIGFLF